MGDSIEALGHWIVLMIHGVDSRSVLLEGRKLAIGEGDATTLCCTRTSLR